MGTEYNIMAIIENRREKFIREFIQSHNKKRALHGAQKLKSSKRLTNSAQIWATKLLEEGSYELSNSNEYGESIAMKFKLNITKTGLPDGEIIVGDWYEEHRNFDFHANHYCKGTGHFSQMIWKSTKYIGVGVAWDSNGKVVIVAHYKPAGNIAGYFAENVSVIDPIKHPESGQEDDSESENEEFLNPNGTLVGTTENEVFETDANGNKLKIVIKTEFYQLWRDGVKLIRTVKKKRTYNLSPAAIAPDFTAQLKRYNITLPETNQNEIELRFANEMHFAINAARKKAGVDELTLNVNLNKMAQYWASHLANTSEIQPHEDIRKLRLGESITSIWHEFDKKPNAGEVVNEWLVSGRFHNRTHHVQLAANYTQLVWRSTKEVGCAFFHNQIDHRTIVVCYF